LEPCVDELIDDPGRAREIAGKLVKDPSFPYLILISMYEMLYVFRDKPEEPIRLAYQGVEELKEKLRVLGIDLSEHLDLVVEHDVFKLKLLQNNLPKFLEIFYYMNKYGELVNYNKTYIATILLLIVMLRAEDTDKLRRVTEEFKKQAEELDTYTATFEYIVTDHGPEGQEIDGIGETDEETRQIYVL